MTASTDPIVFARDARGNLEIPLRKASGLEAVGILLRAALLTWRDEYFLDRSYGTPYIETSDGYVPASDAILGQPYDRARVEKIIRSVVAKVAYVTAVSQVTSAYDGASRALSIAVVARTEFGDLTVSTATG